MNFQSILNRLSPREGFIHRTVRKVFPRDSWLHKRLQSLSLWVEEKAEQAYQD